MDSKLKQVVETVDFYRGIILDIAEQEWGESPHWSHLRSRLLKAFGERGLQGRITAILSDANRDS